MVRTARVAAEAGIGGDGIALGWSRRSPEADYCGRFIPWSLVRDADPEATPPELRLTDGRTVFIASAHRERLATALAEAGVAVRRRPDVWQELLEPFLDTEYDDASRTRCEGRLHDWGFTDREIRDIRRRVRMRMLAETMVSWEWQWYGHADVLAATGQLPRARYLRFRRWADAIAARAPR